MVSDLVLPESTDKESANFCLHDCPCFFRHTYVTATFWNQHYDSLFWHVTPRKFLSNALKRRHLGTQRENSSGSPEWTQESTPITNNGVCIEHHGNTTKETRDGTSCELPCGDSSQTWQKNTKAHLPSVNVWWWKFQQFPRQYQRSKHQDKPLTSGVQHRRV